MTAKPLSGLLRAAGMRFRAWAARRHGRDALPAIILSRRIYILPTRYGLMLAALVVAMLIAGLNYNSNLGLAFAFLMASLAVVAMHHCHRNLLGLKVDIESQIDAFAGSQAALRFALRNDSILDRRDIEIRCTIETTGAQGSGMQSVPAKAQMQDVVGLPVARRGVIRLGQFEMHTRYPFGWFHAWTYVYAPLTVFAAPRPHGIRPLPPAAGAAGAAAVSEIRGEEDFAGLRAYEPGMPLKHMAWKVLARGAEPAVRSYSSLGADPEWLDWHVLGDLPPEARLSQLCRWILDREAAGRPYALRLPRMEIAPAIGPAHRAACLRALAALKVG